jgi:hypothetical protein
VSAVSELSLRRDPIRLLLSRGLRKSARAHAAVARGLLGPAEDPLHAAKEVPDRPGPLSSNLRA